MRIDIDLDKKDNKKNKAKEQKIIPVNKRKSKKEFILKIFSILGMILGIALIAYPFIPEIVYFFQSRNKDKLELPYETVIVEKTGGSYDEYVEVGKPIPVENTLVIPKIGVDVAIVEGLNDNALLKGVWHRPGTGNPVDGGNFVISGHRFRYLPPNNTTFYNLDKLEKGDVIIVYFEGKEYDYIVEDVFIVNPEDVYVEEPLGYDAITLYTCTPLWTSSQRLIVRALPIK